MWIFAMIMAVGAVAASVAPSYNPPAYDPAANRRERGRDARPWSTANAHSW